MTRGSSFPRAKLSRGRPQGQLSSALPTSLPTLPRTIPAFSLPSPSFLRSNPLWCHQDTQHTDSLSSTLPVTLATHRLRSQGGRLLPSAHAPCPARRASLAEGSGPPSGRMLASSTRVPPGARRCARTTLRMLAPGPALVGAPGARRGEGAAVGVCGEVRVDRRARSRRPPLVCASLLCCVVYGFQRI